MPNERLMSISRRLRRVPGGSIGAAEIISEM